LRELGHDVELLVGHERGMFGRGQVRFPSLLFSSSLRVDRTETRGRS
jgi:hypothetical protein